MPGRPEVADVQSGFAGGLNTTADDNQLAPNELRRADNLRYTEYGGATKRTGTQRTHATAIGSGNPIRGGHSWTSAAGTKQLAISNGTLYTGTYSIGMSWTAQVGAFSTSTYPSFADFRDNSGEACYIADGGLLNKWDGTTLTVNIVGTPNVSYVWVYNQRLLGVGDASNPETIYWSSLNNGDTLGIAASGGGSAKIETFGESSLVMGAAIGNWADIIHRRGVSRFEGWDSSDITIATGARGISPDVGSLAPHSLVVRENVASFLSDRGIYELRQGGVFPISSKIEATIQALDQTQFPRVRAAHNKANREVWYYFPDIGVYVYNYRLLDQNGVGIWSGPFNGVFTSAVVYSMWAGVDSTGKPIVLFGGGDGFVRKIDAASLYKDDYLSSGSGGTTFTLIGQCHRMFFRSPTHEKAFRKIWVTANTKGSTTASIAWSTPYGSGQAVFAPASAVPIWGSITWNAFTWGGAGTDSRDVQASGRGTYMDLTITDDGASNATYSRIEAQGFDLGQRG